MGHWETKGIAGQDLEVQRFLTTIHGKRADQEGRDQTEGWPGSCQLSRHRYLPSLGGQLGIRGSQSWSPSPASPSMCADFNVRKAISSSACIRARHGRVTRGILRFAQSAIYRNNNTLADRPGFGNTWPTFFAAAPKGRERTRGTR